MLTGATIANSSWGDVTLQHVVSGGLVGTPATGIPGFDLIAGYLVGPTANLQGAQLAGVDLHGLDFTNASLISADLTGAGLEFANLTNVDLRAAHVHGADLGDAVMTSARGCSLVGTPAALPSRWSLHGGCLFGPTTSISGANLAGVDLSGIDLTGGYLTSSNLDAAVLAGATLTGVHSNGNTGTPASLPTGWQLVNGFLIGPGANLSGCLLYTSDAADD